MIDVNKITSTLAKLPDAMLQKYAQLNKADPYIMALAMSESNRRKAVRSAGEGAQGMQAQPKVVDSEIAQMAPQQLPEDQGIGRLPAGNMNFAGGGIIAFADGGDVERYSGETGSFTGVPYADVPAGIAAVGVPVAVYRQAADIAARMGTSVSSILGRMGYDVAKAGASSVATAGKLAATGPGSVVLAGGVPATQFATDMMANNPQLREAYADNPMMGAMDPNGALAAAILDQANPKQKQKAQETLSGTSVKSAQAAPTENNAAMAAKASASPYVSPAPKSAEEAALLQRYSPTAKAAPTADTTRKAPAAGLGAAAAAAAASPKDDPFSMASIRKAQTEALGDSNYKIGELNNQLVDIRNKAETQVQQRLDDRKKEIEVEGDVYKDRSDRLVARGKELAGQKDQNTGLALLNAGLAIMSTPGGLATALGKGAQVGTAQYAAGIKDLRAAQERLDEANDRISDLRMNRKDLNSREIRALEKDRDAAILDGQKMVFGFAKDVYGMDRKQAEATFTSYMSGQEKKADIQSRERIAATSENRADARANAPTAGMREAMLLGKGDTPEEKYLSGLQVRKDLMADKQGMQMLKLFLEENGRREKVGQDPLTMEQFRRQSSAFFAPPAAVDTSKPTRP